MPTPSERLLGRLGFTEERFRSWERRARIASVGMMVATGIFFIVWPPMSTSALWGGWSWAPIIWGFFMVLGGTLSIWGIHSRILQVEQTGKFILVLAIAFYILNQTLIMFQIPITPTRAGGTGILVAYLLSVLSRYFAISADIKASRAAKLLEGR